MGRALRLDLVEADLVVADDEEVERRVDLAQPLHQVIGERVVIIDQDDHGSPTRRRSAADRAGPRRGHLPDVTRLIGPSEGKPVADCRPTAAGAGKIKRCASGGWHSTRRTGHGVHGRSVTILIAMSSTGGIFFNRNPNNLGRCLPNRATASGYTNNNPDGYGTSIPESTSR